MKTILVNQDGSSCLGCWWKWVVSQSSDSTQELHALDKMYFVIVDNCWSDLSGWLQLIRYIFQTKFFLSMVAVDGRSKNPGGYCKKVDGRKFNKIGVKKADHEKVT